MDEKDALDKKAADGILRKYVESIFVDPKKKADMTSPNNIAALITAASKMSKNSDGLATPETTTAQLLDLYDKTDDKKVTDLLGMSSTYVKSNIGYSIPLEDMAASRVAYDTQKEVYGELYTILAMRKQSYEKSMSKTI